MTTPGNWTPQALLILQDATRPHFVDEFFGEWPPQAYPMRHVRVDNIAQASPSAPVYHILTLAGCGHQETVTEKAGMVADLRISTWHCTQCPKVSLAVRGLDLMGERR